MVYKGLKYLIIHSTNTREGKNISLIGDIRSLYSDVIDLYGNIVSFLSERKDKRIEAWELKHKNNNIDSVSRNIAYIGGSNKDNTNAKDTRTEKQKETLEIYVKYMIKRHPNIQIAGYNQLKDKSSPNFKVSEWLKEIRVDDKNIFGL